MSGKDGSTFVIKEENKQQCDLCGKIEELRPMVLMENVFASIVG
jgi:hypothetical protein